MRAAISVSDYEAAERELYVADARRAWRRHATLFAAAVVVVALGVPTGNVPWLAYVVVALWAVVLASHYYGWVRHGDERIREQQTRVEWRAGRENEQLVPRG
jgi:hypothetical protein